jgi:hypothetical protein
MIGAPGDAPVAVSERPVYGTSDPDAPVTRADFERALRHLNLSDLDLRDAMVQLAARVVALVDELTRRMDGVEPAPAAPGTPAQASGATVEVAVQMAMKDALAQIRAVDAGQPTRVALDLGGDKYATEPSTPPCAELLHLCKARCCQLPFALSTADLDEGVIRWDYGQPYMIRQRASDRFCVHNDPDDHTCTVHEQRPRVCRTYDCRDDKRVWLDYAQRIVAPSIDVPHGKPSPAGFDLMERARQRAVAILVEDKAISDSHADAEPHLGPRPRR